MCGTCSTGAGAALDVAALVGDSDRAAGPESLILTSDGASRSLATNGDEMHLGIDGLSNIALFALAFIFLGAILKQRRVF